MGIDPGLNVTGYAVVEPSARGAFVVEAGVIRPGPALQGDGPAARLDSPGHRGGARGLPTGAVALEQVHSHVNFPRTAILMAHARGVIVLAAAQRRTPVFGYAATRIKKTLTGSGRAPKSQIQHAIMTELGSTDSPSRTTSPMPRRGPLPLPDQPQPAPSQGYLARAESAGMRARHTSPHGFAQSSERDRFDVVGTAPMPSSFFFFFLRATLDSGLASGGDDSAPADSGLGVVVTESQPIANTAKNDIRIRKLHFLMELSVEGLEVSLHSPISAGARIHDSTSIGVEGRGGVSGYVDQYWSALMTSPPARVARAR